jgi:hypothetical protein
VALVSKQRCSPSSATPNDETLRIEAEAASEVAAEVLAESLLADDGVHAMDAPVERLLGGVVHEPLQEQRVANQHDLLVGAAERLDQRHRHVFPDTRGRHRHACRRHHDAHREAVDRERSSTAHLEGGIERRVDEGAAGGGLGAADHPEREAPAVAGAGQHLGDVTELAADAEPRERKPVEGVGLGQQRAQRHERPDVTDVDGAHAGFLEDCPIGGHVLGGATELAEQAFLHRRVGGGGVRDGGQHDTSRTGCMLPAMGHRLGSHPTPRPANAGNCPLMMI